VADDLPNIDETATAAFLHDVGKLEQRAAPDVAGLPDRSRGLQETILPWNAHRAHHTHWHAMFTDAFFEWAMDEHAWPPRSIDLHRTRQLAIYHHRPDDHRFPWTWLVAEADRLSSGHDRKPKDAEQEAGLAHGGFRSYRRTPLVSIVTRLTLGGNAPAHPLAVAALEPETLFPATDLDTARMPDGYESCRDGFRASYADLAGTHEQNVELFHAGLISASERWMWAIPSSTIEQPDVGLHDHALSTAAIASCLHAYHAAHGSLADSAAIKNREVPKFRLLEGDLSGIQASLFRLARQQVRGGARILRARSFLMGAMLEAAALLLRRRLGLPPYVVLQAAGGKFLMLVPDLAEVEDIVADERAVIERWLLNRYSGDLALNLSLGPAFAGEGFARERWPETLRALRAESEQVKQRPLSTVMSDPVLADADYEAAAEGACPACGVRPGKSEYPDGSGKNRCVSCHQEQAIGRDLPHLQTILWRERAEGSEEPRRLFDRLDVIVKKEPPHPGGSFVSAWQPRSTAHSWPPATRFVANHVPTFEADEWEDPRYEPVVAAMKHESDIDSLKMGGAKTFHHLACEDREQIDGKWRGRPMLAVLKADVDRLGQLFTRGLVSDRTVGRSVALSRLVDAFFTGWLTDHVRRHAPNVYTVYAGGDDLLLIGPWLTTIRLAADLRGAFRRFAGDNPDVTLSAGIELSDPKEPVVRSVARAEERLDAAKRDGRDRVSLVLGEDRSITWSDFDWALAEADALDREIRDEALSTAFLYRLLWFADRKARADHGDHDAADWTAKYRYHLARLASERRLYGEERAAFEQRFHELIGIAGDPRPSRIPITLALYRHR